MQVSKRTIGGFGGIETELFLLAIAAAVPSSACFPLSIEIALLKRDSLTSFNN